jgi:hypothetical protein
LPKIYTVGGVQRFDWFSNQRVLVSHREERRNCKSMHIAHFTGTVRKNIEAYLETINLTIDEVRNDYMGRELANHYFIDQLQQEIVRRRDDGSTLAIYRSGKFAFTPTRIGEFFDRLGKMGVTDFWYMGTFYRVDGIRQFNKVLEAEYFLTKTGILRAIRNANGDASPRIKPRFRVVAKPRIYARADPLLLPKQERPRLRV